MSVRFRPSAFFKLRFLQIALAVQLTEVMKNSVVVK